MPDNTLAQIAINITLYHWGIHGWIVYCLVGLLLALMTYRENLPMTMKSCFYPLIGDKIFGWMGDAIDTISVLTTLFGVCTSLGLGTRQLNTGFHIFNSDIDPDDITIQVGTVNYKYQDITGFRPSEVLHKPILYWVHNLLLFTDCNYLGHYCHCNSFYCIRSGYGYSKIIRNLFWIRNVSNDGCFVYG